MRKQLPMEKPGFSSFRFEHYFALWVVNASVPVSIKMFFIVKLARTALTKSTNYNKCIIFNNTKRVTNVITNKTERADPTGNTRPTDTIEILLLLYPLQHRLHSQHDAEAVFVVKYLKGTLISIQYENRHSKRLSKLTRKHCTRKHIRSKSILFNSQYLPIDSTF